MPMCSVLWCMASQHGDDVCVDMMMCGMSCRCLRGLLGCVCMFHDHTMMLCVCAVMSLG